MATEPATTIMLRAELTPDEWRKLRALAARRGVSVQRLAGEILRAELRQMQTERREAALRKGLERIEGGTETYSYRELREIARTALSSADTQATQKEGGALPQMERGTT